MSKGSQFVGLRFPPELLARMRQRIGSRNGRSAAAEWTTSDYIRYCIERDLAHNARSNGVMKHGTGAAGPAGDAGPGTDGPPAVPGVALPEVRPEDPVDQPAPGAVPDLPGA